MHQNWEAALIKWIVKTKSPTVRTVNIRAKKAPKRALKCPFFFKRVVKCPKNHDLSLEVSLLSQGNMQPANPILFPRIHSKQRSLMMCSKMFNHQFPSTTDRSTLKTT